MGNSTKPLTNTQVSQAKPKAKEYNLADGQGLFLRVKLSGTKLWLVNQRPKLSTCQRPKLSSLATFSSTTFMVFEAIRVIAGLQDVAMMRNAIQ